MIQTPFRFPGSKNKLLPHIMKELDPILKNADCFSDGFVGGGPVLLEVAAKYPNIKLFVNDKDRWIYCFWKIVADSNRKELDQLLDLLSNKPTIKLFNELRQPFDNTNIVDCAYRCLFFNRTTFSGIINSGPIGGQDQKSKWTVDCRYNFNNLKKKIEKCHLLLVNRTTVENFDISQYPYLVNNNYPIYLDPPYVRAGKMLYSVFMSENEHINLSNIIINRSNWVLSYDNHALINKLYSNCNLQNLTHKYCIDGKKTTWSEKTELIITPRKLDLAAK